MADVHEALKILCQSQRHKAVTDSVTTQRTNRAYLLLLSGEVVPMDDALEAGFAPPLEKMEGNDTEFVYADLCRQARETIAHGPTPNKPIIVTY